LYLTRCVAGAALYCEPYAPEPASGSLLLVAGGEADPAWCADGHEVTIIPNKHYPGLHGPGASVNFPLRLGPATLISLSPTGANWTLVWSTGELVESRFADLRGPNAMFRFDSGDVIEATTRWIGSGASHHCALGPGRLDVEMPAIANALGILAVRV
jgi:L-arabinose isomerase